MYTIDWNQVGTRAERAAGVHPLARISPAVWCLGVTSMLTDVSSEMVSSVLPAYLVLHLRMSPLAFGVIDGLNQGMAALLRVAAGAAGDRWQRHKAIAAAGYAVSAACKIGILAAGQAWSLVTAAVALDRLGKGIRTSPRDAMIALSSGPGELATAFGVHRALDAAGAMLGPVVALLLLATLPERFDFVFLVSFCLALLGVAVLVLFVNGPRAVRGHAAARPGAGDARGLLRDRRFRRLLMMAAALSLCTVSDAFVFLVLQRRAGFSATMFPLLYVGVALVNFLIAVPGGGLADRWGRLRVFLGGHVLLLGIYGLLLLPEPRLGHIVLCVVLLGAYYAATDGVLAAAAGSVVPSHLCGSGLGLMATAVNLGRLGASLLFGLLWTGHGIGVATAAFMAALVVGIAGVAAAGPDAEPRAA